MALSSRKGRFTENGETRPQGVETESVVKISGYIQVILTPPPCFICPPPLYLSLALKQRPPP